MIVAKKQIKDGEKSYIKFSKVKLTNEFTNNLRKAKKKQKKEGPLNPLLKFLHQ